MRIVMITATFSSGVRTHLVQLCESLIKKGHEVHLIYSDRHDTGDKPPADSLGSVNLYEISTPRELDLKRDLDTFKRYRELLRDIAPELVHCHSSKAGFLGRLALVSLGWRCKTPVLYTPHSYGFLRRDCALLIRSLMWMVEFFLAQLGTTVAVSEDELFWARTLHLHRSRAVLVPNSMSVVEPCNIRERVSIIATSGRLAVQKNYPAFLDVAENIVKIYPEITFEWIGGGTEDAELRFREEVESRGLTGCVRLTGWLPNESVRQRLKNDVDIYVSTSLWEGLSYSVLEALSVGLPCVVLNATGYKGLLQTGENGIVVKDIEELCGAINQLILDEDMRRDYGNNAVDAISTHFNWDVNFDTYHRLIESI